MEPRSRSTSSGSRGQSKDCQSKKEVRKSHVCLQHAPYMDPDFHLWNPEPCHYCTTFLQSAAAETSREGEYKQIFRQILRGVQAVARRKVCVFHVPERVYTTHLIAWMEASLTTVFVRRATIHRASLLLRRWTQPLSFGSGPCPGRRNSPGPADEHPLFLDIGLHP